MPNQRATNRLDVDGLCDECGQQHLDRHGHVSCAGHVRFDRNPDSPTYRARLDQPRPCQRPPSDGLTRCYKHGTGSKAARDAGARNSAARKARADLKRLIPERAVPIKDPFAVLAELAGEADAVRRAAAAKVNKALKANATLGPDDLAYLPLYERAVDRLARTCEALIRGNYLERHLEMQAAMSEAQAMRLLAAVHGGLLIIEDPELRQRVTSEIAANVRALVA